MEHRELQHMMSAVYAGRHRATETVPKCLDSNTQSAPEQDVTHCTREGAWSTESSSK